MAPIAVTGDHLHTAEERSLVTQLRAEFAEELEVREAEGRDYPCLFGDLALLRVLRGNGNDLKQAADWFARCLTKVEECNLDQVVLDMTHCLDESLTMVPLDSMLPHQDDIQEYVRAVFSAPKLTPSGDLVNYISFARFDMWKMIARMKWEHWVSYMRGATVMRMIECDRQSRLQGRLVRVVTIIDVAGCSLGMFNCPRWHMQHSRDLGSFQESVAAEIFGPVVVLNAPWIVQQVISGAFRFLPERFRGKVRLMDGDGTADEAFVSLAGGEEQLRQLLSIRESIFADGQACCDGELAQKVIPRREAFEHSIDVVPGQRVEWEFELIRGLGDALLGESDVAFSVDAFWTAPTASRLSANQLVQVLRQSSWERLLLRDSIRANVGRTTGFWEVTRPGVLRLTWSNRHSALRAKGVLLRVSATEAPAMETPSLRPESAAAAWSCCFGRGQ